MSGQHVSIERGDEPLADVIENKLLASLRDSLPQAVSENVVLVARAENDAVVGGLSAGTSYGWLLIKALWVDDGFRRRGVGRQLVAEAEAAAQSMQCHAVWLDTSNPSARTFYEHLGYTVFGELSNEGLGEPAGHCRWFLRKAL